jgi:phosphoribulokinase
LLRDSFMSRANTIVCPGGMMDPAMQLLLTPLVWRLIENRDRPLGGTRHASVIGARPAR